MIRYMIRYNLIYDTIRLIDKPVYKPFSVRAQPYPVVSVFNRKMQTPLAYTVSILPVHIFSEAQFIFTGFACPAKGTENKKGTERSVSGKWPTL